MRDFTNKTVVYSRHGCPHCVSAKQLLNSKNIKFEEIIVDGNAVTKESMNQQLGRTDLTTVPQIVLNGQFIPGGNSGLKKHFGV